MSDPGDITGAAADFGSGPGGLSTRADLGLDDPGLAGDDRLDAQRALDSLSGGPRAGGGFLAVIGLGGILQHLNSNRLREYAEENWSYADRVLSFERRPNLSLTPDINELDPNQPLIDDRMPDQGLPAPYGQYGEIPPNTYAPGYGPSTPEFPNRDQATSEHDRRMLSGAQEEYNEFLQDDADRRWSEFRGASATPIGREANNEPAYILPTGLIVPAPIIQNFSRTIGTGGMPGPAQRVVIDAMTPAQQRAAGIFLAPDGTVRPFREVLTAAVTNAAAGRPLTTNQQAALGLAFNGIPSSGARRDAINALAGSARGAVRDNISAAVGQSMRAARDIAREARQQTAAQQAEAQAAALKAAGVRKPRQALARLEAAGVRNEAASKLAALKAAGVTRPVSQVERLAAQGVRNPVQRLMAQADRRDKAAATAAGTTVNKLRALRAAGVQQPAQKVAQLKAAGARRPVEKLAQLRQAGVKRAAQKLVQLGAAGVKRPAQKIAALRQAGIKRGVQKVAQLKAAGMKRPAAKLAQLQQAGVKRRVQQLVQLKQAGVRRPAQKLLAQAPAQRGALGKQTQEIIRTTDQSLTFKTAGGQTRTAAQVAANAAKNLAAGRPLTPNQQRLLASAR